MLTYTTGRNLAGKLTGDSSSANLTILDTLINESIREIITMKPWNYRETSTTISTVASQQFYNLPSDCIRVNNVTITIGTTKYTPREVKTREDWDRINQTTNYLSNIPVNYFVFGGQVGFWPTPVSATANAITLSYLRGHKDLNVADYTTGTITTATNGSTGITGSGTSWTSQMAGRFIRITLADTANTGDGTWYKIASVTSTTVLVLSAVYTGNSISAGSASYVIGQVSIIPEEFQMVPIHRACEIYFSAIQPEQLRAGIFKNLYAEGIKRMNIELGANSI